jgi:hypothetical protein
VTLHLLTVTFSTVPSAYFCMSVATASGAAIVISVHISTDISTCCVFAVSLYQELA